MATFAAFTNDDWDAFGGAERFPDGSEPMVCYDLKVDQLDAVVVLDQNGAFVQVLTPDGDEVATFTGAFVQALLIGAAAGQLASIDTGTLIDMGFQEDPTSH